MSSSHTPESGQLASTMPNMIISLALICGLMAALLAGVFLVAKPQIDANIKKAEQEAISTVMPAFDNHPAAEAKWFDKDGKELDAAKPENDLNAVVRIFPARKGDQLVGIAVKSFTDKGYGKRISVMFGFAPDGTILGMRVIEQGETPGLGTKMTEPDFQNQFLQKNPATFRLEVKKDGGDVDAITAATISSRAFCDALARAYKAFGGFQK